ncbi:chromosome partitioning protein ParA, partial [Pseudomonas aeruginosa]|nr:chromosome partitioning protein ParA [Pseudomonas aeruginosa]
MNSPVQPDTEAQRLADLNARESWINTKESEIASRETAVATRERDATAERQVIEQDKAKLAQREQAVTQAEQKCDAGFADERAALNDELREKRAQGERAIAEMREKNLSALEVEISELKAKRLGAVAHAENAERERIRTEIAQERDAWTKQQGDARKQLNAERTEFEKQKGALSALQSEVEGRQAELETSERTLERKEQRLEQQNQRRSEQLDDEVERRVEDRRKSLEAALQSAKEENIRLREAFKTQDELLGAFEQLKLQLGGKDPAEILRALNSQADELKRLREELATRPTEEMRERYQALESEAKNQKTRADQLERQLSTNEAAVAEIGELRRQGSELNAENKSLAQRASIFEGAANEAQAELKR